MRVTIEGKNYTRETNTMPQWAGSCWYYLRYIDPKNPDRMLPVYDGGDHLHPGDAGYKAMGEAIDLAFFK